METGSLKMEKLTAKNNTNITDVMPGPLYVTRGSFTGEVNLQWDAIGQANNYIIEISKNGSSWHQVDIVSDPQYSIQGLTSGKTYSFRISAIFKNGHGPWSEPVTKKIK